MSALYESCGGCGAETPSERCIGCLHDFGPSLTTPSNANTSGLEVVWARLSKTFSDRFYEGYEPEIEAMSAAVVTATSAQARIAELESALAAAQNADAENDAHLRSRATATEARADRLAKAGDRLIDALHRYGFPVSGGARVALTDRGSNEALELDEAASNFRAALQQESAQ